MASDTETFIQDVLDEALIHAYDPAKAKAYYERTKQLKGRKKGAPKVSSSAAKAAAAKAKKARLKAAAEKRVFDLKVRLKELENALDKLSAQAKARSGVDPKSSAKNSASSGSSSSQDRKPLTAAQKRDAAKKAAERREKESDQSLSSQEKTLEDKIAKVRERIEDMKVEIVLAKKKTNG